MATHYCPSFRVREYGSSWAHPPRLKCSEWGGRLGERVFQGSWFSECSLLLLAEFLQPPDAFTLLFPRECVTWAEELTAWSAIISQWDRFLLFSTIDVLRQVMWWGLSCACQDVQQDLTGLYWLHAHSTPVRPHEPQHSRPPCPSQTPRVHPNPYPLSRWCHPTISSSVIPFSSCPQSFPASGSFPMSQLFASGDQSIGVSASTSVLPMNTQDWYPLGWTGWISLQSKGLSRVFSNTTVQKHQFFSAQLSLQSNSNIHTWPLEKP